MRRYHTVYGRPQLMTVFNRSAEKLPRSAHSPALLFCSIFRSFRKTGPSLLSGQKGAGFSFLAADSVKNDHIQSVFPGNGCFHPVSFSAVVPSSSYSGRCRVSLFLQQLCLMTPSSSTLSSSFPISSISPSTLRCSSCERLPAFQYRLMRRRFPSSAA